MKHKDIKTIPVEGAISVLKILPYKGCMIYIRRITGAFGKNAVVYEYLVVYKGEIFSSFILTEMKPGQKKLSHKEELFSVNMIFTGAVTTIDTITDAEAIAEKVVEEHK